MPLTRCALALKGLLFTFSALVVAACTHTTTLDVGSLEPRSDLTPEEQQEIKLEAAAADAETPADETPIDRSLGEGMVTFSGGGYRSLLFALGAAWRLNELGTLCRLANISSVSGGSILAAHIALHWKELCPAGQKIRDFGVVIAPEVIELTHHTIDVPAVFIGALVPWSSASFEASKRLDKYLYHGARLRDLTSPRTPSLFLLATDLSTGLPWEFSGDSMGILLDGDFPAIPSGELRVADAVAASAAFPPVLSPARFSFPGAARYVERARRSTRAEADTIDLMVRLARHYDHVLLGDGGLTNNLGTEACTIFRSSGPCFVTDAAVTPQRSSVYPTWFGQLVRSTSILYDRKEDEIRVNTEAQIRPGPTNRFLLMGGALIQLRSVGDVFYRTAYDSYARLKKDFPILLGVAGRRHSSYTREWAAQADRMWNGGYMEGDVRAMIEHYEQYACNSMISTRLKSLDDHTIHNLVNLGYVAAELSLDWQAAANSAGRSDSIPEALEEFLEHNAPGLLRTKLHLPMPLEPTPTTSCRAALR